jgi:hypothetical protein
MRRRDSRGKEVWRRARGPGAGWRESFMSGSTQTPEIVSIPPSFPRGADRRRRLSSRCPDPREGRASDFFTTGAECRRLDIGVHFRR